MRKRILIVFPYANLAFSPMTLNLYDALASEFDVKIVAPEPHYYSHQRVDRRDIIYVKVPERLRALAARLDYHLARLNLRPELWRWLIVAVLCWRARQERCDEAIGADFWGLWLVQRTFGRGHLLSLEIYERDLFRRWINDRHISSVIIQSKERFHHLFGCDGPPAYLIQNAPVYRKLAAPQQRQGLIFCGTAVPAFGIYRYLDFLRADPTSILTIQGAVPDDVLNTITRDYADLLRDRRLVIRDDYFEQRELAPFVSRFRIGLCCYDLSLPGMNTFNYHSAPSGKLFTYFAAGVPVIATRVPGLQSVEEFNAGVLIDEFTPEQIRPAIDVIESAHDEMTANCFRAAQHFSFDIAVQPFVESLRDN